MNFQCYITIWYIKLYGVLTFKQMRDGYEYRLSNKWRVFFSRYNTLISRIIMQICNENIRLKKKQTCVKYINL